MESIEIMKAELDAEAEKLLPQLEKDEQDRVLRLLALLVKRELNK